MGKPLIYLAMARAVFMGSDSFSAPVLEALLAFGSGMSEPVQMVGVVTQPDRLAGRGRHMMPNPIKTLAIARGVPVLQPDRVGQTDSVAWLRGLHPDVVVVASFGQILPRSVLDTPARGCLNLHPSLLPRYRGPSPIVGAILAGERRTGTTLTLLTARMDAGPILSQAEIEINPEETAGELTERLASLSGRLLIRDLPAWLSSRLSPVPQEEADASYTQRLRKEDGRIEWTLSAELLTRRIRAFNPWPTAYTFWKGRMVRLLRARAAPGDAQPGEVVGLQDGSLLVGTGEGLLLVQELQLAGGKAQIAPDLVRGHPDLLAAQLSAGESWSSP